MDILLQLCGWAGAAGLLIAFFLNSTGKLASSSRTYQLINLFSALLLAINAFSIRSYPFIIINGFWAGVALYSLLKKK